MVNGSRTKRSATNAKIMQVITKSTDRAGGGWFVNHKYDLALIARLDLFYYLLIIYRLLSKAFKEVKKQEHNFLKFSKIIRFFHDNSYFVS